MAQQQLAPTLTKEPPVPFWTPQPIDLHSDLVDKNNNLSPLEQQTMNQMLAFFEVANDQVEHAIQNIKKEDWKVQPHRTEDFNSVFATEEHHARIYSELFQHLVEDSKPI